MYQFGRRCRQRPVRRPIGTLVVALLGTALAMAGCDGSTTGSQPIPPGVVARTGAGGAVAAAAAAASSTPYYLSLGDSYAAGYQPTGINQGHTTTNGFAYQTVTLAQKRGDALRLVNLGCAGATTASILTAVGCPAPLRGPGGPAYNGQTQVAAATAFLRQHRGQVGLITISIGGNDVTNCASSANALTCVAAAAKTIKANVSTLAVALRQAAGPGVQMIGLTYPDVILGEYLSAVPAAHALAGQSVTAFKALINPTLKSAYALGGASFIDVTAATGAYGSMAQFTTLRPYGKIPVPVAKVCTLTYYCVYGDIHPKTIGYARIAELITAQLPQRG